MPPSAGGSSAHSFGSFSPILKTPAAKRGSRAAAAAADAWSDCTPPSGDAAPSPARIGHTAVLVGEWMVLYGGVLAGAPEREREVSMLHVSSGEWVSLPCSGAAPSGRAWHSATAVGETMLLVYGGSNGSRART